VKHSGRYDKNARDNTRVVFGVDDWHGCALVARHEGFEVNGKQR
jgi:hypothetical protein